MAKKKTPFNKEMAMRGAQRRLFARSPLVIEKLQESRQEFPRFNKDGSRAKKNWVKRQCEVCGEWVSSSKISVDHIDPVVPPMGFTAPPKDFPFDDVMWRHIVFTNRLWCDKSNLQRLCDACHNVKSYKERIVRLLQKYNSELDEIETLLRSFNGPFKVSKEQFDVIIKDNKKLLSKYIAKKKTPELLPIVQRALILRENLLKGIYNV